MKTTTQNIIRNKGFSLCILFACLLIVETYAQYGTSRRVARRTARRTSARHSGYYGGAPAGVGYVNTLPGGCVLRAISGINYQYCNGAYYQPFYQGTEVVYQEVDL